MAYYFTEKEIERLRRAMDRAPSILNQRPWKLEPVAGELDRVELYSDPDPLLGRLLPREVVISCGAALYNVRLAIKVIGRQPSVSLLPDLDHDPRLLTTVAAQRTLLAAIEVMPGRASPPSDATQELYEALWLRRTDRWPYEYVPIPPPILVEMETAAAHERGWLRILPWRQRRQALRAVASANRRIRREKQLEEELFNPGKVPPTLNKVPLAAYGPTPAGKQAEKAPPTRPTVWLGGRFERFEKRRRTPPIARRQTQLMGLSTDDDRPLDWLRAGEALQHALLNGTRFSMSALGGRSTPYRQQLYYGPLDPNKLWRRPPPPGGYAVEASFLTQSLDLADLIALQRAGGKPLELADLEAVDPRDAKNKQRRRDSKLRWPWRTYFTEIPQVVMRVGYTPVRGVFVPGSDRPEPATDDLYTVPFPRPASDDSHIRLSPVPEDDYSDTYPFPRHAEEAEEAEEEL
jgi:hypothetical protein